MALGDLYVSSTELAAEFGIDDLDDDDQLTAAVRAAQGWVNHYCEREFNQAASATARVYYSQGDIVRVDDISTDTGLIIKSDTSGDGTFETTWTASDYQLEPLNGIVRGQTGRPYTVIRAVGARVFPITVRPSVEVTARWGWAAVPEAVKSATKIQAARLYKRRDSAEGVLAGFGDFGPVRVGTRLDPDVQMLLEDFVLAEIPVA